MIYTVKKENVNLKIDDNIFFRDQPAKFRKLYKGLLIDNQAVFDNCTVLVLDNGRVIITENREEDEI